MRNLAFLAAGAAVLPLCLAGAANAAGRPDYGGKATLTIVHQEATPLDKKGHVVLTTIYKGTNVSTGRLPWMDGAEIMMADYADLIQGSGRSRGFGADVKGGVAKPWSYVSKLKTVMVDGRPRTTSEVVIRKLAAAPMKHIRSHCVFTSKTTMDCEWTATATKNATR